MDRPIVVCPLRFEFAVLERAGLGRRARLECCGPGAAAMRSWVERCDAGTRVLLAGLAGGLRPGNAAGSAWMASAIVDASGRRWAPSWPGPHDAPTAVIVESGSALTTPAAKRACARHSGADLVDLESAAFAEAAAARGWRWAVVRGVSDDAAAALPPDVERWVDARGRSRPVRAILSLARRPSLIGPVLRVRSDGLTALRSAAELLATLLDDADGPAVP